MKTTKKLLTLCLIQKDERLLLGMKKRGFGRGRWNGFGGKVNSNESIDLAAKRELKEEAGIIAQNMEKFGILDFKFLNNPEIHHVHIFKVKEFKGEPQESEEMKPQWFHVKDIPFKQMWSGDKYWIPLFLKEKKFRGTIFFDESDNVLEKKVFEVREL